MKIFFLIAKILFNIVEGNLFPVLLTHLHNDPSESSGGFFLSLFF